MSIRVRRPMVVVAAAVALGAGAGTAVLAARESGTDAAPLPSDQQVGAALAATGWGESVAAAHVVSSGTPATASLLLAASGDAGASALAEWEAGVAASGASLDLPGLANVDLLLPRATGGSFVADSAGSTRAWPGR